MTTLITRMTNKPDRRPRWRRQRRPHYSYDVKTNSVSRYLKGKGKRTATLIGGGAGGGALIGGLAGGGRGALIGVAIGAGAGTAGAAYTGEKEIVLPAESTLSFKLTQPVTLKM